MRLFDAGNFSGTMLEVTADSPAVPGNFNDKTSSIAVSPPDSNPTAMGNLNTQFFNEAREDLTGLNRNPWCVGSDGVAGCVSDVSVAINPGRSTNLTGKALSVVAPLPDACEVRQDLPLSEISGALRLYGAALVRPGDADKEDASKVNALLDSRPLKLRYSICAAPTDQAARLSLAQGASRGVDPCSGADVPVKVRVKTPGQFAELRTEELKDFVEVDELFASEPLSIEHDLFVPPETEACKRLVGAPGSSVNWAARETIWVRACVDSPFDTSAWQNASHCFYQELRLRRLLPVAPAVKDASSNSYSFTPSWSKELGNKVANVKLEFNSTNRLDVSGASSHTDARLRMGGWFSLPGGADVAHAWTDGDLSVSNASLGLDRGIEMFGQKLTGDNYEQSASELKLEQALGFAKEKCLPFRYSLGIATLDLTPCVAGGAGIDNRTTLRVQRLSGALGTGALQVDTTPHADLQLTVAASLSLLVVKAGITGTLEILNARVPIRSTLGVELVTASPPSARVTAAVDADVSVALMNGYIDGWVSVPQLAWCSFYPCLRWGKILNARLASFQGYTLEKNIYNRPPTSLALP